MEKEDKKADCRAIDNFFLDDGAIEIQVSLP